MLDDVNRANQGIEIAATTFTCLSLLLVIYWTLNKVPQRALGYMCAVPDKSTLTYLIAHFAVLGLIATLSVARVLSFRPIPVLSHILVDFLTMPGDAYAAIDDGVMFSWASFFKWYIYESWPRTIISVLLTLITYSMLFPFAFVTLLLVKSRHITVWLSHLNKLVLLAYAAFAIAYQGMKYWEKNTRYDDLDDAQSIVALVAGVAFLVISAGSAVLLLVKIVNPYLLFAPAAVIAVMIAMNTAVTLKKRGY